MLHVAHGERGARGAAEHHLELVALSRRRARAEAQQQPPVVAGMHLHAEARLRSIGGVHICVQPARAAERREHQRRPPLARHSAPRGAALCARGRFRLIRLITNVRYYHTTYKYIVYMMDIQTYYMSLRSHKRIPENLESGSLYVCVYVARNMCRTAHYDFIAMTDIKRGNKHGTAVAVQRLFDSHCHGSNGMTVSRLLEIISDKHPELLQISKQHDTRDWRLLSERNSDGKLKMIDGDVQVTAIPNRIFRTLIIATDISYIDFTDLLPGAVYVDDQSMLPSYTS